MTKQYSDLLKRFEAFDIKPDEFGHRQHVEVAYEILGKYDYVEACAKYAAAINTIATSARAPSVVSWTATLASGPCASFTKSIFSACSKGT